jgi:hypothetical protein
LTVCGGGLVNIDGAKPVVGKLSIADGGQVNLNSALLIDYSVGADPISMIQDYLASGEINSSTVAALKAGQSALIYAIGSADGADGIVSGLSSGQIEIMPALAGDAKLQGDVVFADFQLLAEYFGESGGWDQGNFNYGPSINFGDFQLLAQNFGANAGAMTASETASLDNFAAAFGEMLQPNPDGVGFILTPVPEPVSMGLIAVAGAALLARRRRTR